MCPVKSFKIPEEREEWVTDHMVNVLRDKNNLFAKARRTGNPEDKVKANKAKKEGNKFSRSAKRKYIREELKSCEGKSTEFWRKIQKLIPDSSKHAVSVFFLSLAGRYLR